MVNIFLSLVSDKYKVRMLGKKTEPSKARRMEKTSSVKELRMIMTKMKVSLSIRIK